MPTSYYTILGVDPSASAADIKHAYRMLARNLHPDLNPSAHAAEQFILIQQAFAVLGNKSKRAVYDRRIGVQASVPPPSSPPPAADTQPEPGPTPHDHGVENGRRRWVRWPAHRVSAR